MTTISPYFKDIKDLGRLLSNLLGNLKYLQLAVTQSFQSLVSSLQSDRPPSLSKVLQHTLIKELLRAFVESPD